MAERRMALVEYPRGLLGRGKVRRAGNVAFRGTEYLEEAIRVSEKNRSLICSIRALVTQLAEGQVPCATSAFTHDAIAVARSGARNLRIVEFVHLLREPPIIWPFTI